MTGEGNGKCPAPERAPLLSPEDLAREERWVWVLVGLVLCGMAVGFGVLALSVALDWY